MKKLLIPVIGLLVLILITPVILSKLMNSNIDKKIANLQKQGYQIKEVKKDIGYISTKREFEVTLNDKLKQKYHINALKADVVLSFKNLPVTTANFDVEYQKLKLFNQEILDGYKFHLKTKNLKHFKLIGDDYKQDGLNIIGLNGNVIIDKFITKEINVKNISYKDNLNIDNLKLIFTLQSYEPLTFEGEYNLTKFSFKYQDIEVKAENAGEKFKNYFNKEYKFSDKFKAEKFGVLIQNRKYAVSNWQGDFNANYDKNLTKAKIDTNFEFTQSQIENKILDGADFNISARFKRPADLFADVKIRFDKDLFTTITNQLDPAVVKKYFKNHKTHFIFNNGEMGPYGN
jgi:hypothetical protein